MKVRYPHTLIKEFAPINIFLAGPCNGTRDWHNEVITWFDKHKIKEDIIFYIPKTDVYEGKQYQIDWETKHLNKSYNNGLVVFYLSNCIKDTPGRGFARTTRFELGEWLTKYQIANKKTVIGIEDGFEGRDYIIHRLHESFHIYTHPNKIDDFCKSICDILNIKYSNNEI
jgi:hypothetical protein